MGVQAAQGVDEYDTIGLTRHRMTDDWLTTDRGAAACRALL